MGIALVALTLAGIIYEQIGRRRDRTRYPQIGQSIDIGEGTLNIFCSGQGSPTVVLDRGGHTAGYTWISIQPEISKLTRTCWYDRAGYGWSDSPPTPRTSRNIANELHLQEMILARFRGKEREIFARHGMEGVGYWVPTDEPLAGRTIVYMLKHKSRAAADASWNAFRADPEWVALKAETEKGWGVCGED
ncbi:MAG: NIPSNAP family protein [Acidobacteriaceae bacterium]